MAEQPDQHPDPASLSEWGPGQTARGRARLPSSRRRERPQLSCNLCRERKLRCDRQTPCSNCTKRAVGMDCVYLSTANRPLGSGVKDKAPVTAQDRIKHLESVLVDLMRKQQEGSSDQAHSTPHNPEPSSLAHNLSMLHIPDNAPSPAPSDSNSVYLTEGGESYVISAHWAAVLDDIAELKDHFEEAEQKQLDSDLLIDEPQLAAQAGPQLLYGCSRVVTKEEILASIPDRPVVDQLVSCYFNSFEMSPAVLHSVQFLEEYEEFWKNPTDTPVIWLGLLFTILCLATEFQKYKLEPTIQTPGTLSPKQNLHITSETFRQRIVHCLILGNYAKGGPYVLQTLMLYIAVELFLSNDAETSVWILLGTIVQLAMQMGYHRDPKYLEGKSPFASEMQRRMWATVVELDLGISAQMGLPRLIRQWQADTMEPSNLQDHDFDKTTTKLPTSRPETDLTPMLFRIVRGRMLRIVGAIWDFATDTRRYTYTDVINMDSRLQDAHSSIPVCLKWRSAASCIADTPQAIMQKIALEIMVYRASIVLHRKFLHEPPTNLKAHYSRQKCLDAALKLLEYQHILQEKTEPFGQLYHERWKVSSLVKHDFLLATSILCSYLQQVKREVHDGMANELPMVDTIRKALRQSQEIWLRSSSSSREAQKAAKALSIVLGNEDSSSSLSGVNTPFTMTNTSSPSNHTATDGQQNNWGSQFVAFNATAWTSLSNQTTFEPMVPFSVPAADGGIGLQPMDTLDAMESLQWPWDN